MEIEGQIIDKDLALWVADGGRVAVDAGLGLGGHINTVLQTFFL